MKRWVISFVILGIGFSFIGCTSDSEKSSNVLEIDEAKCAEIEEKFGLEKITKDSLQSLSTESVLNPEEYKKKREIKINKKELTREGIDEIVERAKFLVDKYYTDELKEASYIRLDAINLIDRLGFYLNDELAFELLKECVEYYEPSNLEEKIKENDESIYWYHYTTNLLYDYYSFFSKTDDLSTEKYIIELYLYSAKEYVGVKALNESGFYKNIIKTKFLKEDLQRAKEVFVERRNDVKKILDKYWY
ncbi:hypothetical protein [Clostridium massiliamazoniense]|uniref:hypothetical protein n=1 Tax=Clostridium massiliamazoniense TaxID=1347366 RepID=UPI0006D81B91|nr:hypothetical protein [Clostridium massiliamazoniense]